MYTSYRKRGGDVLKKLIKTIFLGVLIMILNLLLLLNIIEIERIELADYSCKITNQDLYYNQILE